MTTHNENENGLIPEKVDNIKINVHRQEVFLEDGQPLERPVEKIEEGPLYKGAEEVLKEIDEDSREMESVEPTDLPVDRRDFMKVFAGGAALAATSCVRRPAEKVIPYVDQPIDQVPGVAVNYATTCGECSSGCGLVVKTREGRPVKIEGSDEHPLSMGGTCAMGQGAIQGLYHPERKKSPMAKGESGFSDITWEKSFTEMGKRLAGASNVAILTKGSTGNRNNFLKKFLERIGSKAENLFTYDSDAQGSFISAAYEKAYGLDGMPRADLIQAKHVVSISSDFMEHGVASTYNNKRFFAGQAFRHGALGKFTAFESTLSNTGSMANKRHVIPVGEELTTTFLLITALLKQANKRGTSADIKMIEKALAANSGILNGAYERLNVKEATFDKLAADLMHENGKAVLMAGGSRTYDEHATELQLAALMANVLIGAHESVLFFEKGWMSSQSEVGDLKRLMAAMPGIDYLIVMDLNPSFVLPTSTGFQEALGKVGTVVSIQDFHNETSEASHFALPGHHNLESWGDEQPVAGFWSARQPTVRPQYNSRQGEDVLLWLAATIDKPLKYSEYRDYVMERWQEVYKMIGAKVDFDTFFSAVLRRGFVGKVQKRKVPGLKDTSGIFNATVPAKGLKLIAPLDTRIGDGRGAHLPVLQETADGLSSVCWDSWVQLNPNACRKLGLKRNDEVVIEGPGGSFTAAIYPMPGLSHDAVVVNRGNGHDDSHGNVSKGIGVNPLVAFAAAVDSVTGDVVTAGQRVKLKPTGKKYRLATIQKMADLGNRTDIVKRMSLSTAAKGIGKTQDLDNVPDLYPNLKEDPIYRWGLSIDLNRCNGCGSCTVACSVENNVPQVGRKQAQMGRAMYWIHTDRYFAGDVDNPEVVFQPMLCQQCNHAPCEGVCPVYATTHNPEGFNNQTYNRCIGTRYCANACTYKVRRFNWYTHKWNEISETDPKNRNPRALNPDVTVRTAGVMEKCTFCYQRVRDAKHTAIERANNDKARARIVDGEVKTACQQACASDAITFGNLKDPRSKVAKDRKDMRSYLMLGGDPEHGHYGIKTLPNVSYLAKVTHDEPAGSHN